jgi:hypothetical protein
MNVVIIRRPSRMSSLRTLSRATSSSSSCVSSSSSSSRARRRASRLVARAGRRDDEEDDDGPLAALRRLNPFAESRARTEVDRARSDARAGDVIPRDVRERVFGRGIAGKIVGAAANAAANALRDRMSVVAENSERCYEESTRDVKLDRALDRALGGGRVECGPATRASTSSAAANGVETARTFVAYQVRSSATGRVAVVSAQNDGARTTSVATLDDGRTLEIGRASGGGGGETDDPYASGGVFDVEADDVIDA